MSKEKFIKVTSTKYYSGNHSNGWTEEELLKEWFGSKFTMSQHHASRDGSLIDNTEVVDKAEFVTVEEFRKDMDAKLAIIYKEQAELEAEKKRIQDERQAQYAKWKHQEWEATDEEIEEG